MTAELHNFIVTEMGGLFLCCYARMLRLQGSADVGVLLLGFCTCLLDRTSLS